MNALIITYVLMINFIQKQIKNVIQFVKVMMKVILLV